MASLICFGWVLLAICCLLLAGWTESARKKEADPFDTVCKDENGDVLDWYILYKFPKAKKSKEKSSSIIKKGLAYGYVSSKQKKMKLSMYSIESKESMLVRTLSPIYDAANNIYSTPLVYAMWNNQAPSKAFSENNARGHSKGVLLMNRVTNRGALLSHSAPRYPQERKAKLSYFPMSATQNAQLFMCVSFDVAKYGDQVGQHIDYIKPIIYDSFFSKSFLDEHEPFKNLTVLQAGKLLTSVRGPKKLVQVIKTLNGQEVDMIAKTRAFTTDVYSTIVSDLFGPLYVQTWRSGKGSPLHSSCPIAFNVNSMSMIDSSGNTILHWRTGSDHSKWAVTTGKTDKHVFCAGDINRAESQFTRGGGALCLENEDAWFGMRSLVEKYEECSGNKKFVNTWVDEDDEKSAEIEDTDVYYDSSDDSGYSDDNSEDDSDEEYDLEDDSD